MPFAKNYSRGVLAASGHESGAAAPSDANHTSAVLRRASKLVEHTAYDAAGSQPSTVISQLIIISADLERLAQLISRQADQD